MKINFKTSKCAIIAILTFCLLFCISGTQVFVAMAEGATVTIEENIVVVEDFAQELVPVMARSCENDYSDIISGKPYVPYGCTMVRHDVASVNSSYFIGFVKFTFGSFRSNQWKKHMETWEDDDGNSYECHYWQGPNGVTYYHN